MEKERTTRQLLLTIWNASQFEVSSHRIVPRHTVTPTLKYHFPCIKSHRSVTPLLRYLKESFVVIVRSRKNIYV